MGAPNVVLNGGRPVAPACDVSTVLRGASLCSRATFRVGVAVASTPADLAKAVLAGELIVGVLVTGRRVPPASPIESYSCTSAAPRDTFLALPGSLLPSLMPDRQTFLFSRYDLGGCKDEEWLTLVLEHGQYILHRGKGGTSLESARSDVR